MSELKSIERTSRDHDILYEIKYGYDHYHRVPDPEAPGSGDTIPSHKTREKGKVHIVAPTPEIARAVFDLKNPPHVAKFESLTPLLVVDHIVEV